MTQSLWKACRNPQKSEPSTRRNCAPEVSSSSDLRKFAPHFLGTVILNKSNILSGAGTCDGGIFTYEKTTGYFLRTAVQDPLATESTSPGITAECSQLCLEDGSDCPAFSVDYGGQRCFKLDRNTQVRRQ